MLFYVHAEQNSIIVTIASRRVTTNATYHFASEVNVLLWPPGDVPPIFVRDASAAF